ncbi:hypothetical protein PG913_07520 [Tenacibaculum pacificus]|uniref:hypothetical protein n=1 Tax=Tenacibaculum pacificus TaxID=3018314 RepID=UPI0022F3CA56|nr:hypothetical protein [Tenacibaculum pacificus]WBX72761.1 hypothetical protein PG913_07520 [Tenacibaculum pacificus]
MKFQKVLTFLVVFFTLTLFSQSNTVYRAETAKVHDLIHTKLKVDFNFKNQQLNGEEWVTSETSFL